MREGAYYVVSTGKWPEDDYTMKTKEEAIEFAKGWKEEYPEDQVSITYHIWESVEF